MDSAAGSKGSPSAGKLAPMASACKRAKVCMVIILTPGAPPIQLHILLRGLELLAVGGRLAYSTCSLDPLQNEAVVHAALKGRQDVR